ncbi:hypothetical protein ACFPK9_09875 [Rubritalea spongiae]|uniref:Uncharacterized protein n=1 Tax=Rubritalea spongiae TaxID=430797 RepID=A0ABW5E107_9BACT
MSKSYNSLVSEKILPLSVAANLSEAFTEWKFTEHTIDHESATEECGLCSQKDLRYHFEIENELTSHKLMVGSSCILKFDVKVFEDGELLNKQDTRRKLNKLIERMHQESCFKALEMVLEEEDNPILRNALSYYKKNKYFTPKFAFVVLWRLNTNQINHNPSYFNVKLNKDSYKRDLEKMNEFRVHTIWKSLSSSQRALAERLGHKPPKSL